MLQGPLPVVRTTMSNKFGQFLSIRWKIPSASIVDVHFYHFVGEVKAGIPVISWVGHY